MRYCIRFNNFLNTFALIPVWMLYTPLVDITLVPGNAFNWSTDPLEGSESSSIKVQGLDSSVHIVLLDANISQSNALRTMIEHLHQNRNIRSSFYLVITNRFSKGMRSDVFKS